MPLLRRRKLDRVVKDAYWDAVLDCLTTLFGVRDATAAGLIKDRRAAVDLAPLDVRSDVFYHKEPFDVARELAKSPTASPVPGNLSLDDQTTLTAYESILGRHGLL